MVLTKMEFKKAFFLVSDIILLFVKVIGFVIKMKTWNNEYHKYS